MNKIIHFLLTTVITIWSLLTFLVLLLLIHKYNNPVTKSISNYDLTHYAQLSVMMIIALIKLVLFDFLINNLSAIKSYIANLKRKTSIFSISLSSISFSILVKINYDLALKFMVADGKTQALFGLVEISYFSQKAFTIILSIMAMIIPLLGLLNNSHRGLNILASIIGFTTLVLNFINFWPLFTH